MPYGPDKINEVVEAFNTLGPGEDIIHGNDIQIKELAGTQRAFEYGKYTDDILDKIQKEQKERYTNSQLIILYPYRFQFFFSLNYKKPN